MHRSILHVIICLFLISPVSAATGQTGAQLFTQHCASCHGSDGKGGTGVPLANKSFQQQVSDHFLFSTIRHGRPGRVMPTFNHLSEKDINAIVAHVRTFTDAKPPKENHQPIKGDIAHGKKLFHDHCAACHGADGKGSKGTGVTFSRPRDLPILAPAFRKGTGKRRHRGLSSSIMVARVKTSLSSSLMSNWSASSSRSFSNSPLMI